jgi:hypothetical protein
LAQGPIRAMFLILLESGKIPSFFRRTIPSTAA